MFNATSITSVLPVMVLPAVLLLAAPELPACPWGSVSGCRNLSLEWGRAEGEASGSREAGS